MNIEELGKENKETLDAFCRGGWVFVNCGDLWVLLMGINYEHEETFTSKVEATKSRPTLEICWLCFEILLDEVSCGKVSKEFNSFLIWWRASFILGVRWIFIMKSGSKLWRKFLENFSSTEIDEGCAGFLEGSGVWGSEEILDETTVRFASCENFE